MTVYGNCCWRDDEWFSPANMRERNLSVIHLDPDILRKIGIDRHSEEAVCDPDLRGEIDRRVKSFYDLPEDAWLISYYIDDERQTTACVYWSASFLFTPPGASPYMIWEWSTKFWKEEVTDGYGTRDNARNH